MSRLLIISCAIIVATSSTAGAKEFRVLQRQNADIARFQRGIKRSDMHPKVKQKIVKSIERANNALLNSNASYKRLNTRVTKNGGELNFSSSWDRTTKIQSSAGSMQNVTIFNNSKNASWTYRAKYLSPKLTLVAKSYLKGGHANPTKETSRYSLLHSQDGKRSTLITTQLAEKLFFGGHGDVKRLVSQIESMMAGGIVPKGLDLQYKTKTIMMPQKVNVAKIKAMTAVPPQQ